MPRRAIFSIALCVYLISVSAAFASQTVVANQSDFGPSNAVTPSAAAAVKGAVIAARSEPTVPLASTPPGKAAQWAKPQKQNASNTSKASNTPRKSSDKTKPGKRAKPATPSGPPSGTPYGARSDALALADELVQMQPTLRVESVRAVLAKAQFLPLVAKLIAPPPVGTPKNWQAYQARFIEPLRIKAGVKFWLANRATLARAEAEFGVPAQIIVGIIGVETIYGQQVGSFRVVDALATLSLDFPAVHPRAAQRSAYFKSELAQFLALAQERAQDPLAARGSFAGAMGLPQFMPSSFAKFAVDFDGDGKIDLANSAADAIGSVANYFKAYGWQTGTPTHYQLQLEADAAQLDTLMAPDILPTFNAVRMQELGVRLDEAGQSHAGKLALIELQNGPIAPSSYVAGTDNFYVITRYNWSSYYAMAVIELGDAVAAAIAVTATTAPTAEIAGHSR